MREITSRIESASGPRSQDRAIFDIERLVDSNYYSDIFVFTSILKTAELASRKEEASRNNFDPIIAGLESEIKSTQETLTKLKLVLLFNF